MKRPEMFGERGHRMEFQWSQVFWRLSRGSEETQGSGSGRNGCLGHRMMHTRFFLLHLANADFCVAHPQVTTHRLKDMVYPGVPIERRTPDCTGRTTRCRNERVGCWA